LQVKYFTAILLVASFGFIGVAYAHTRQVIGDYAVEVGWKVEPPISGMDNAITVMFTPASVEDKTVSEKMMKDMDNMTDKQMAKTNGSNKDENPTGGISGLATSLDVTITLNNAKTTLSMVEDQNVPGLYVGKFTPPAAGFASVHVYAKTGGKPIEGTFHPEKVEDGAVIKTMTSDGSVNVNLVATAPSKDEGMLIKLEFTDIHGASLRNVNYDIIATQDGTEVLSEHAANTNTGDAEHSTNALSSADPVDIQITILGIGPADDKSSWSGPKDQMIPIHVAPEFGALSVVIFAVSAVSIVAIAAKSKSITKIQSV
jgi:predicted secreted protein with PEFG-CTERM motif